MDFWSPCFLCISGLKIPVVSAAPNIHPCCLAQWGHCALLGCCLPVPWSGKCPEEWGQGQFGPCLMCFPAVRNLGPSLPIVNAWTWLTCFVSFTRLLKKRANPIPISESWWDVEVSVFHSNFFFSVSKKKIIGQNLTYHPDRKLNLKRRIISCAAIRFGWKFFLAQKLARDSLSIKN